MQVDTWPSPAELSVVLPRATATLTSSGCRPLVDDRMLSLILELVTEATCLAASIFIHSVRVSRMASGKIGQTLFGRSPQ